MQANRQDILLHEQLHELEEAMQSGSRQGGSKGAWRRAAEVFAVMPGVAETSPYSVADWYALAGEKALALTWLEKAVETRDPNLPYLGVADFDSLRDDPRFQNILRRIHLDSSSLARAFPTK